MLKPQYFDHLMQRADSLEKTLMLGRGGQEEKRAKEDETVGWHHQLNRHESEQTPGDSEGQWKPGMPQSMGSQSRTQLSD